MYSTGYPGRVQSDLHAAFGPEKLQNYKIKLESSYFLRNDFFIYKRDAFD